MPLLSRSLRPPPSLRSPLLSLSLSFSVSSVSPFFVIPPLCRSLPPGVRPLRYQQRSPSDSAALSCERPSPPTSFRRLRSRSSFSFATSRPPPHLIHIHAVVIVCRLPAGGHYYTSCARSRHREATTPATLLLLLPFLSPTLLRIRFPLPAAAADAVVFRLYVARLCNDTYNPRVFYYRVSRNNSRTYHAVSPQGFFICWLRSREFANNCAQTFPQNAPQGDVK